MKPTPVPSDEYETPSAGINWKLFLLVAGIIGIAFFAGMAMKGGDNTDIEQSVEPNNLPVAVETEVPEPSVDSNPTDIGQNVEPKSGLKLLKKVGPIELLPYKEQVPGGTLDAQQEKFSLDESENYYAVSILSNRDSAMKFKMGFPTEEIFLFLILRDKKGNLVAGSIKDVNTGIFYVAKGVTNTSPGSISGLDRIIVERVSLSSDAKEAAETWEVLVYG